VDLFFSTDAVLDGADVAAGSSSLAVRLKPGRSRAARVRFVYPTLAAGDYFVLARVRLNGAGDADPSDDTATTAAPVRVG